MKESLRSKGYQYLKIIETGEYDRLEEIMHPEYRPKPLIINENAASLDLINNENIHLAGINALIDRLRVLRSQFSEIKYHPFKVVVDGNKLVFFYQMSMVHTGFWNGFPPSGNTIKINGVYLFEFDDGKIRTITPLVSIIDLIKQIGIKEEPLSEAEISEYLNNIKRFLQMQTE